MPPVYKRDKSRGKGSGGRSRKTGEHREKREGPKVKGGGSTSNCDLKWGSEHQQNGRVQELARVKVARYTLAVLKLLWGECWTI